jgi:glycosyltransferase involved in cell wall biosynthesis
LKISIVTGFFLPVPATKGGATEKSWYGLAEFFAAAGHSVTFISRSQPGWADEDTVNGVRHIRVSGFDHTRYLPLNLFLDLIWGIRVALALPSGDVVICNTVTLPIWLRSVKAASGLVAVMIGRTPKGQVAFYRKVARIYAPSTSVLTQIGSGWAAHRTRVIGYPIDWNLHSRYSKKENAPITIGYVGRLHPEKGIVLLLAAATLLRATEGLPEWRLKIIGPSEVAEGGGGQQWLEELQSGAKQSIGSNIEWKSPEYDPERLAQSFAGMHIFCYPSLAEKGETFGVSVAEAMAARCAVVVSALQCFSDLVSDGETGLIFDHRDEARVDLLAETLRRLIVDPVFRDLIAGRGQTHARKYDYPKVSENILSDLALLTGARGQEEQQSDHA